MPRAYHQLILLDFQSCRVYFWSLFMVEIDVKDEFLLNNKVLPCKNITLVYKGKCLKIYQT